MMITHYGEYLNIMQSTPSRPNAAALQKVKRTIGEWGEAS